MSQIKVTSADVAALAGVSQSAVSRVFTPGASASAKTALKVREAAVKLGYRPNSIARAMVSGKSRIIGLVVAYLENQFYPEALEKLSAMLQDRGYHVLIFMANTATDNLDEILDEILDYQVDGIVAASVALSSQLLDRCQNAGVPVVLFNRSQDLQSLSSVTSDNLQGGRKVAEFLLATAPNRIGYIAGWEGASTQRDREFGFRQRLAEDGRDIDLRTIGNFHMDSARQATLEMFDRGDPPDAIFVANDHMAFAVMDTLRFELGLSVPHDVSVVGYDDVPTAAWRAYDLTTVRQPVNQMVARTVETLLQQIDDPDSTPSRVALDGPLIIRRSVRLPEGWTNETLCE